MRAKSPLLLLLAVALSPAGAPGIARAAAHRCVGEDSTAARAAGDAPPTFSTGFAAHTITLDVSLDGIDGDTLPLSIEDVCDFPRRLARQAQQLAGADGVAVIDADTSVWLGRRRLRGTAAAAALDGGDTAVLRVRLLPRRAWREDEDGDAVATFTARRVQITD